MKADIQKAIEEFSPLFDAVTTSDLQGICEARAFQILADRNAETDFLTVMKLSDEILEGIYSSRE